MNSSYVSQPVSTEQLEALKPVEVWHQDDANHDLWYNRQGLIINTVALENRQEYYYLMLLYADNQTV